MSVATCNNFQTVMSVYGVCDLDGDGPLQNASSQAIRRWEDEAKKISKESDNEILYSGSGSVVGNNEDDKCLEYRCSPSSERSELSMSSPGDIIHNMLLHDDEIDALKTLVDEAIARKANISGKEKREFAEVSFELDFTQLNQFAESHIETSASRSLKLSSDLSSVQHPSASGGAVDRNKDPLHSRFSSKKTASSHCKTAGEAVSAALQLESLKDGRYIKVDLGSRSTEVSDQNAPESLGPVVIAIPALLALVSPAVRREVLEAKGLSFISRLLDDIGKFPAEELTQSVDVPQNRRTIRKFVFSRILCRGRFRMDELSPSGDDGMHERMFVIVDYKSVAFLWMIGPFHTSEKNFSARESQLLLYVNFDSKKTWSSFTTNIYALQQAPMANDTIDARRGIFPV